MSRSLSYLSIDLKEYVELLNESKSRCLYTKEEWEVMTPFAQNWMFGRAEKTRDAFQAASLEENRVRPETSRRGSISMELQVLCSWIFGPYC